jgi:hypothetical protein
MDEKTRIKRVGRLWTVGSKIMMTKSQNHQGEVEMRMMTRRTPPRRKQGNQGKGLETNDMESDKEKTMYCHAGNLCHGDSSTLVLEGPQEDDETIGVLCSKCKCPFHIVCLYILKANHTASNATRVRLCPSVRM